jgi:hypothetical protein
MKGSNTRHCCKEHNPDKEIYRYHEPVPEGRPEVYEGSIKTIDDYPH